MSTQVPMRGRRDRHAVFWCTCCMDRARQRADDKRDTEREIAEQMEAE